MTLRADQELTLDLLDGESVATWQDDCWGQLTDAVTALESAWKQSPFPELGQFVPADDAPHRDAILVELIKVDQEMCWRAGQHRRLEEYLRQWPELSSSRQRVANLLAAECLTRASLDVPPTSEELRSRFPDIARAIPLESINAVAISEKRTPAYRIASHSSSQESSASINGGRKSIAVGDRIDGFEIRGVIGKGGMGIVFHAHDVRLKRDVALKIPHLGTIDREVADRFLEEARTVAAINHPHICPVFESGEVDGIPYFVMPLLKGEPLDERLRRKSPQPSWSVAIVVKLAGAVAELHAADILHLDLKPQNIMIDVRGEPLLMDFGLAWKVDPASQALISDALAGTPAYMSPEQVCGSVSEIDSRTDIYSLGVLLYELLTGKAPFQGSLAQVLAKIPQGGAESPRLSRPQLKRELETVCLKAMATKPADRFQSVKELIGALERYILRAKKARERRRAIIWSCVAGVVLLAIGVRVFLDFRTNRASETWKALSSPIPQKPAASVDPLIERIQQKIATGVSDDPGSAEVVQLRLELLDLMREHHGTKKAHSAAVLLVKLPWPEKPSPSDPNVWMKTVPNPDDPVGGGVLAEKCQLPAGASVIVYGRIKHIPFDNDHTHAHDSFWIWFEERKPVIANLVSLTPGIEIKLTDRWQTPNKQGDSNIQVTSGGIDSHILRPPMEPPENFFRYSIEQETDQQIDAVEYLVHVWQTEPPPPDL